MKGGALLMLLLAIALGCSRAAHRADSGSPQSQTRSQESDTASAASAAPEVPSSESQRPDEQPAQAEPRSELASAPTALAERYRLENEAPQGMAWVTIRNTYLVNQYVFLDDELMGWVPPDTEGRFEVPPGAHNVTLSDSEDGSNNAKVLAEVFDAGYSYYYDVVVH